MRNHKYTAGLVLAGCLTGAAATYNLQHIWVGNLFYHGFLAASIGGLADWYAVTALFRKPLGVIGWRTQVIPKNRQRLMDALKAFVCEDLLSTANVMSCLRELAAQEQLSFSRIIVSHLETDKGMRELKAATMPLVEYALHNLDKREITAGFKNKLEFTVQELYLTDLALDALRSGLNNNCAVPLLNQLAGDLDRLLDDPRVKRMAVELMEKAAERYKSQGSMRSFAMNFAELNYEAYAQQLIEWLHSKMKQVINDDNHPAKIYVRDYLIEQLMLLQQNRGWVEQMDKRLIAMVQAKADVYLEQFNVLDKSQVEYLLEKYVLRFQQQKDYQDKLDGIVLQGAEELLERNHDLLERLVADKLHSYSTEEIVELIESRVGDDLQLIRVNGSLIGGLAGMALFVLSTLAKGAI